MGNKHIYKKKVERRAKMLRHMVQFTMGAVGCLGRRWLWATLGWFQMVRDGSESWQGAHGTRQACLGVSVNHRVGRRKRDEGDRWRGRCWGHSQRQWHTLLWGKALGQALSSLPAKILLKVIASHAVQVTVPLVLVRICFSHRHQ